MPTTVDRIEVLKAAKSAKSLAELVKKFDDERSVKRILTTARGKGLPIPVFSDEVKGAKKKTEQEIWQDIAKQTGWKFDESKFKARKPREIAAN